jgi:hypothetical protein
MREALITCHESRQLYGMLLYEVREFFHFFLEMGVFSVEGIQRKAQSYQYGRQKAKAPLRHKQRYDEMANFD